MSAPQRLPATPSSPPGSGDDAPVTPATIVAVPRAALAAAIPDLALGMLFLITWIAPLALQQNLTSQLVVVMLMEFIIMHSSAFMGIAMFKPGGRRSKAKTLIGLWIREPWRVLAFGFLYFTATGISELCDHRWIRSRDLPPLELSERSSR